MPVCSVHGSMTAFMPSTVKSSMPSITVSICAISSDVVSFQFFLMNLSSLSNDVGATKKNLVSGQRSLTNEMLRFFLLPCPSTYSMTFIFIMRTTSASCSAVALMPLSLSILSNAGHHSLSSCWMRYWWLNHAALT